VTVAWVVVIECLKTGARSTHRGTEEQCRHIAAHGRSDFKVYDGPRLETDMSEDNRRLIAAEHEPEPRPRKVRKPKADQGSLF
jgi:hypothetical protein